MALSAILAAAHPRTISRETRFMQALAAHVDGPELREPADFTWVGEIPALGATRFPTRTALAFVERRETMTYADLDRFSRAFSALLNARGIQAGDRIAYLGRNSDLFYP